VIASKRNKNALKPLAMFNNLAQMAAQTGIPKNLLLLAQEKGCKFDHHNRYDLKEFNEWYFSEKMSDDEKMDWTRYYKREQALTQELKRKDLERTLVDYNVAGRYITALVHQIFFGEIDRTTQEYPPLLKGRSEPEIEEIVLRQRDLVRKRLLEKLEEWDKLGEVPQVGEET